jgi:hypothetical protein
VDLFAFLFDRESKSESGTLLEEDYFGASAIGSGVSAAGKCGLLVKKNARIAEVCLEFGGGSYEVNQVFADERNEVHSV